MECVICGESTLNKEILEQIANIKAKQSNIIDEMSRKYSDLQLFSKLEMKLKKYDETVRHLEKGPLHHTPKKLCPICTEEMLDIIMNCFSTYDFNDSDDIAYDIVEGLSEMIFNRKTMQK